MERSDTLKNFMINKGLDDNHILAEDDNVVGFKDPSDGIFEYNKKTNTYGLGGLSADRYNKRADRIMGFASKLPPNLTSEQIIDEHRNLISNYWDGIKKRSKGKKSDPWILNYLDDYIGTPKDFERFYNLYYNRKK